MKKAEPTATAKARAFLDATRGGANELSDITHPLFVRRLADLLRREYNRGFNEGAEAARKADARKGTRS